MARLKRAWRALESIPGLAELLCVWKEWAGSEFGILEAYLRPTQRLSDSYPCPRPGGDGCPRRVVFHGDTDIVAVCGSSPVECDAVDLKRSDLIVYELDVNKFLSQINAFLGFRTGIAAVNGMKGAWRAGDYTPVAGKSHNVFFIVPEDSSDAESAANALACGEEKEFIIIASSAQLWPPSALELLKNRNSLLLSLEDNFVSDGRGGMEAARPADEILADFNGNVLPSPEEKVSSMVFFDTPPDARWGDVAIKFLDGHRVSIAVKGVSAICNYAQMGMADGKNGKPTVQWKLLLEFAESPGRVLSRHDREFSDKQRQELAKKLRAFFRVEGDLFKLSDDRRGWEPCFILLPESP